MNEKRMAELKEREQRAMGRIRREAKWLTLAPDLPEQWKYLSTDSSLYGAETSLWPVCATLSRDDEDPAIVQQIGVELLKALPPIPLVRAKHGTVYYGPEDRTPENIDDVRPIAPIVVNLEPDYGIGQTYNFAWFSDFQGSRAYVHIRLRCTKPGPVEFHYKKVLYSGGYRLQNRNITASSKFSMGALFSHLQVWAPGSETAMNHATMHWDRSSQSPGAQARTIFKHCCQLIGNQEKTNESIDARAAQASGGSEVEKPVLP